MKLLSNLTMSIQDVLFSEDNSYVVLGVAVIIILGIGVWLYYMDKKIKNLDDKL